MTYLRVFLSSLFGVLLLWGVKMSLFRCMWIFLFVASLLACEDSLEPTDPVGDGSETEIGSNPFLEDAFNDGKEDTGYVNRRGVEVHVTLEADITADSWRIFDAPAELAQYAVTYLRKRNDFYLEILAEDATAVEGVEWLVDEAWLGRNAVADLDRSSLTHFRMSGVTAVVMNETDASLSVGQIYEAKVPNNPYTTMAEASETCVDVNSHLPTSQSIYWYLWNPEKASCELEVQTMTLTINEVMPSNPESYPEYDQLWADGRLDVVVLFAKLDDGDVADDYNWDNVRRLSTWLGQAGFTKAEDAPLGDRFTRQVGELTETVDIYGPDLFHSVADYAHMSNWQKAVSEHEVVMYNGHSVLGTGYAFEEVEYPDFYQIFSIGSCLSYEYYVTPVLAGKSSWATVDVVSNVEPTYYSENFPLTTNLLARLFWGFENDGRASWQDIMEAVSNRLHHSMFGVSGARGNSFTPTPDEPNPGAVSFNNADPLDIPDNDPTGVASTIEVGDDIVIAELELAIDLAHTYVGDLEISLEHGDLSHTIWNRSGGSDDDITATFDIGSFDNTSASGTWTLTITDNASIDTGQLRSWTLSIVPIEE